MKTSNEIRAEIKELNASLEAIEALATKEDRDFTEDETRTYDEGIENLDKLNAELERAEKAEAVRKRAAQTAPVVRGPEAQRESKEEKEVKQKWSISRAVLGGFNQKLDGVEREMHEEGLKEMSRIGKSGNGIMIPSMLTRANITENSTTGITVGPFTGGLHAESVTNGWVTTWEGIQDYRVPIITATTTTWEGETDAAADGGAALTKLDLSPTRLAAYVNVSKQALMQHNESLEAALIADIQRSVSAKIDYAMFTADSPGPTDLKNGVTEVEKAAINDLVFAMIEEYMGNKQYKGNLGFIASHSLFAEIATAVQVSGVSALLNQMTLGGHEVRFTPQAEVVDTTKETMYFADWSEVVLAQFGALEILVDPYSQATNGMNQIVLNAYYDFGKKRSTSVTVGAFTGTNV